jgi:hydrogenase nickel incorporation protein HypA/HybF
MHELSVCLSILGELERIAALERSPRVIRVVVGIGPLSGLEPALLRNAFPLAVAGTLAAGAELAIDTVAVRIRCTVCNMEAEAAPNRLLGPACGDFRTRLLCGDDLVLKRVELAPAQVEGVTR